MKKLSLFSVATVIWAVVMGLVTTATAETPICTESSRQHDPAISGDLIVWEDYRNGSPDIYTYDLATGTETPICTHPHYQWYPAISGDLMVWQDYRNGNADIYMYDLIAGVETSICTDSKDQRHPAISGSLMVWQDYRNGNADIYMYDLATGTETPICTDPEGQYDPAISGSLIVWEDYRNGNADIYMYDLATGTETPICTHPDYQGYPAISGDLIVWEDYGNGNADIYMYDLATGTETPICTDPEGQYDPAISGSLIVWEDYRNGNADIYMYDLATGTETPICTDANDQWYPAISGDLIVWEDYRNGNADIYMYRPNLLAPDIDVDPLIHDFGDVHLGSSSTVNVTISNMGNANLIVDDITLMPDWFHDFSITSNPLTFPVVLAPNMALDIEITYAPSGIGCCSGSLEIMSNDPNEPLQEVQLKGTGGLAEHSPEGEIAHISEFFHSSVIEGTLVGEGPGKLGEKRLNVLRKMIAVAADFIENGLLEEACHQLMDVYKKTDGHHRPPDFVKGKAALELATMIQDLMTSLECE